MMAFHIDSKVKYVADFNKIGDSYQLRVHSASTGESILNMGTAGISIEAFSAMLGKELRNRGIRLEKDAVSMHEALTVLYYL